MNDAGRRWVGAVGLASTVGACFCALVLSGCSSSSGAPDSGPTVTLTHATLFRVDNTGTNGGSSGGHVIYGLWTTEVGAQNTPGNYIFHLFLAATAHPAPSDFLDLTSPLSLTLSSGANTFYLFADNDDTRVNNYGFGLSLWLNGAVAGSPGISAFGASPGSTFSEDGTTGCTGAFDGTCTPGAGTLSFTDVSTTVTMTAFAISALGGAAASANCTDLVTGSDTTATIVAMPNGICDTVGSFTLTVH